MFRSVSKFCNFVSTLFLALPSANLTVPLTCQDSKSRWTISWMVSIFIIVYNAVILSRVHVNSMELRKKELYIMELLNSVWKSFLLMMI